jgi:hypothetical protein
MCCLLVTPKRKIARVRHSEVVKDLDCEAAIYGCASGSILVVGACTGVLSVLASGIVATTRVCKLEEREKKL